MGDRKNTDVSRQQTLREPATYEGIGLHSGNRVTMRLLPAEPNTGIRFRRVDLEGSPEIEARVEHVAETNRSTTLAKGNMKIHTVEHVLAALTGSGVDNAIVELDSNEPPIADGSARIYCRMIAQAGLEPQAAQREPYSIDTPMELTIGETTMSVFPHDRFKISCTSSDRQGKFAQFYSLEVTPESWEKEISHARTFCFYEEIEYLIRKGLIQGGSLENAVVIRDDAVLTTEPLRYPEEFARHKILDIIGDLTLVGRPLRGHVIAIKPSHGANCALAAEIRDKIRQPLLAGRAFTPAAKRRQMQEPGNPDSVNTEQPPTIMDIMSVMKTLPHRYPFLMVDRVTKLDGNSITAIKNVTINEPYFQGHFPVQPIMPGVLQLEAMAQVAGIITLQQVENIGKIAYFMSADKVKWRKPVRPGDTLVIEVELLKARRRVGKAKGRCLVNGEVASEAEVTFTLVDATD